MMTPADTRRVLDNPGLGWPDDVLAEAYEARAARMLDLQPEAPAGPLRGRPPRLGPAGPRIADAPVRRRSAALIIAAAAIVAVLAVALAWGL